MNVHCHLHHHHQNAWAAEVRSTDLICQEGPHLTLNTLYLRKKRHPLQNTRNSYNTTLIRYYVDVSTKCQHNIELRLYRMNFWYFYLVFQPISFFKVTLFYIDDILVRHHPVLLILGRNICQGI